MTLEAVFFSNLLKSILVQLGHYLNMRTSKQCNCFQENNEESYGIKKKILQETATQLSETQRTVSFLGLSLKNLLS